MIEMFYFEYSVPYISLHSEYIHARTLHCMQYSKRCICHYRFNMLLVVFEISDYFTCRQYEDLGQTSYIESLHVFTNFYETVPSMPSIKSSSGSPCFNASRINSTIVFGFFSITRSLCFRSSLSLSSSFNNVAFNIFPGNVRWKLGALTYL